MFAGNFAPRGWAFCDGQLLAVSQNDALFSLLGTIYGGDGRTTFGLPDLRGRVPIHAGQGPGLSERRLGSKGGEEKVTLTVNQLASHRHRQQGTEQAAGTTNPTNALPASAADATYRQNTGGVFTSTMNAQAVANAGGTLPHENMGPFLCINFIIALFGIYPSRN